MKLSLLGFNQEQLLEFQKDDVQLDTTDLFIMRYIKDALASPRMLKILDENEQSFVWLQHEKIHKDLPFLNIKEDMLKKRIKKLIDLGLIKSKVIANNSCRGTRAYYGITELFESLEYGAVRGNEIPLKNETRGNEIPLKTELGGKNYTSNIPLDNNIELKENNNTILKDSTAEPSLVNNPIRKRVNLNNDVSEKSYDNSVSKKENKRLNLYEKCMLEIDTFTEDERLREALKEYLGIRLKMKDKPILGVGQWKGILKTLNTLNGDKVAIVERATERGWGSFFELKDYSYRQQNRKPPRSIFGETDNMTDLLPHEVKGGGASGQIF